MGYDEILTEVGEFGLYQRLQYFMLCIPPALSNIYLLIGVFTLGVPKHRCDQSSLWNSTLSGNLSALQNSSLDFECVLDLSPYRKEFPPGNGPISYTLNTTSNQTVVDSVVYDIDMKNQDIFKCSSWIYDTDEYEETATSEFNLVCDATYLRSGANMALYGGVTLGTLVMGGLADRFGRKIVICVCCLTTGVISFASAWSPNAETYLVLRFITGIISPGMYVGAFILAMEMVGPSKRTWLGVGILCACSIGGIVFGLLSYLIRNWRYLQIGVSLMSVLTIPYWWLIQESARWLIVKEREEEAMKIIKIIAKVNGTKTKLNENLISDNTAMLSSSSKGSCIDILKSKTLFIRINILCFCWLAVSLIYYALSLGSVKLVGNLYLNFFIMTLAEIPAVCLGVVVLHYTGRRMPQVVFLILGGVACIGCFFLIHFYGHSITWLPLVVSTSGKFAVTVAFSVVWIYATELFPTAIRSVSVGICNVAARLGSMLAPFIVDFGDVLDTPFGKGLPYIICGVLGILAGVCTVVLPDTHNKKLPETTDQAEALGWTNVACCRHRKSGKDDEMNMGSYVLT